MNNRKFAALERKLKKLAGVSELNFDEPEDIPELFEDDSSLFSPREYEQLALNCVKYLCGEEWGCRISDGMINQRRGVLNSFKKNIPIVMEILHVPYIDGQRSNQNNKQHDDAWFKARDYLRENQLALSPLAASWNIDLSDAKDLLVYILKPALIKKMNSLHNDDII